MDKTEYQINDYLEHCNVKGLSTKTIKSYDGTLRLFAAFLSREYDIFDFKAVNKNIIKHYVKFSTEKGKYTMVIDERRKSANSPERRKDYNDSVSPVTVNNYIRNLKAFFSYLVEIGEIKKSPMDGIGYLKQVRIDKNFISDEDYAKLIKNFDQKLFSEKRDYVITNLLMDTGMRVGECLMIDIKSIDFHERTIFLPAYNTKGKKDRYVFFSGDMAVILKEWVRYKDIYYESDYLFVTTKGNPVSIGGFESNFKKYCDRIGLEGITPHTLRNNFGRRFLMAGGDIFTLSRILGHSSVRVTEKAYAELRVGDLKQKYQEFSPLTNMKKNSRLKL